MFAWKVAPALAAGCTIVIKPAEYTPLTALAFAEIAHEIGLPPGVLNIINGDGTTGAALVNHPGIDKIAFTGSTEVGRLIRKATAATPKKLSLELGGKSPFIVFDDADLDSAVEGLVDGIWFNQGQVCCAGSRLLVQERIAERLYEKIRARMDTLRIGSPLDKAIDIGAIVDQIQYDRIQSLVATGIAEGATCYQPTTDLPAKGLLLQAHAPHQRHSQRHRRPTGNLRPRPRRHDLPHARRGHRASQQHHLRPRRQHLEREHQRRPRRRRAGQSRSRLDQRHQPLRRRLRLWRLSRIRLRPRGRQGGYVRIPRAQLARSSTS